MTGIVCAATQFNVLHSIAVHFTFVHFCPFVSEARWQD